MKVLTLVFSLAVCSCTCALGNTTSTQILPSYISSAKPPVSSHLLISSYAPSEILSPDQTSHTLEMYNTSSSGDMNSSSPISNIKATHSNTRLNASHSTVMVGEFSDSVVSTSFSLQPISPTQVPGGQTATSPTTFVEETFQNSSQLLASQSLDVGSSRNDSQLVSYSSYSPALLQANASSLEATTVITSSSRSIAHIPVNILPITSAAQSSLGQISVTSVSSDTVRSEFTEYIDIQPTSSSSMSDESSYQRSTLSEDVLLTGSRGTLASTGAILSDSYSSISMASSIDSSLSDTYYSSFYSTDIITSPTTDIFPSTNSSTSTIIDYSTVNMSSQFLVSSTATLFSSDLLSPIITQPSTVLHSDETQPASPLTVIALSASYHLFSSTITPTTTVLSPTRVVVSATTTLDVGTTTIEGDISSWFTSTVSNISDTITGIEHISTDAVKTTIQTPITNIVGNISYVIPTTHQSTEDRDHLESFSIRITFKDKCNNLRTVAQLQMEFFKALVDVVIATVGSGIIKENIHLNDFNCDPLSVGIALRNLSSEKTLQRITDSINNSSFVVQIVDANRIIQFRGNKANLKETEIAKDPVHPDTTIEQRDIIIISTASFLFMVLLFFGSVIICRECYLRKRAATFNLLDVPHVDLKLTDFTLTKIPRPHISYCEPPTSRLCQHVYTGQHYESCLPGSAVHGTKKIAINAEDVRVRIHDHDGGLLVGVTCTPPPSPTGDSTSSSSSPLSDSADKYKQKLIKGDHSKGYGKGTSNPIYADEEDKPNLNNGLREREDNMEHMV